MTQEANMTITTKYNLGDQGQWELDTDISVLAVITGICAEVRTHPKTNGVISIMYYASYQDPRTDDACGVQFYENSFRFRPVVRRYKLRWDSWVSCKKLPEFTLKTILAVALEAHPESERAEVTRAFDDGEVMGTFDVVHAIEMLLNKYVVPSEITEVREEA